MWTSAKDLVARIVFAKDKIFTPLRIFKRVRTDMKIPPYFYDNEIGRLHRKKVIVSLVG